MGICRWPWEQNCATTSQNCINPPNNCDFAGQQGSLFCDVIGAGTCADVIDAMARRIGQRLHAYVLVTSTSVTRYEFQIRRGQSRSIVNVQVAPNCMYPINATYTTRCSQTGSATFNSMDQFLNWIRENIQ